MLVCSAYLDIDRVIEFVKIIATKLTRQLRKAKGGERVHRMPRHSRLSRARRELHSKTLAAADKGGGRRERQLASIL